MKTYEFLEHPGDIKIRSYGQSLPELFINTALGMMNFLYGQQKTNLTHSERITIKAGDLESLLVDWLSEILWLSDTNHRLYTHYKIIEFDENKIVADVDSGQAKAKEDIKAVTYHELNINKTTDGWTATVVYDI
jgi:SHS2 domain-containing protein